MMHAYRIAALAAIFTAGIAGPVHSQGDEFYMADLAAANGRPQATVSIEWLEDEDRGNRFCYAISGYGGLSAATSAHLHRGAGGPVVMEMNAPGGAENASDGCVTPEDGLRAEIAANPSAFTADVHTASGTISGTLGR